MQPSKYKRDQSNKIFVYLSLGDRKWWACIYSFVHSGHTLDFVWYTFLKFLLSFHFLENGCVAIAFGPLLTAAFSPSPEFEAFDLFYLLLAHSLRIASVAKLVLLRVHWLIARKQGNSFLFTQVPVEIIHSEGTQSVWSNQSYCSSLFEMLLGRCGGKEGIQEGFYIRKI